MKPESASANVVASNAETVAVAPANCQKQAQPGTQRGLNGASEQITI